MKEQNGRAILEADFPVNCTTSVFAYSVCPLTASLLASVFTLL